MFKLSASSVASWGLFLQQQATVVAVDLANKLVGFLIGSILPLFQFLDVFAGIPGGEHKGDLAIVFLIILGDQVTGKQNVDGWIIQIFFA